MTKPNLIFLHGGPGFKDYLRPFFDSFQTKFHCHFYDQLQGRVSVSDLILQLDQFIQNISGTKILVGHSWGGVLAVEYAAQFENKLSALVLMATGLSHKHWQDEFQKEIERLGLVGASPEQIYLTVDEVEEGKAFLDQIMTTFSSETFDSLDESYLQTYDVSKKLSALKLPILNVYGEKDVRFPKRITSRFSELNSRIVSMEIRKAGHLFFYKEETRQLILKKFEELFLNKDTST